MRLETRSVNDLKPAPYNPRIELKPGMPEYERLKRSLKEFELVQPLVWNEKTGYLVGGHQRLNILKEQGLSEVPVIVVSLSEEKEKALNVTLNNDQVGGSWDLEQLQDLMKDLIELPDFDETLTGFDQKDLNSLLMNSAEEPSFEEEIDNDENVTVTMKVFEGDWEYVKPHLDDFLEQCDVEVHIDRKTSGS